MTVKRKAFLALLLIAVLWGSSGVTAKLLVREMNIFVVLFYRFGIASLLVTPLFLRQPKPEGYLKILVPFSMLNSFNALFFYAGLSRTTSNAAYIINTSTPLVIAVLAHFLIHEQIQRKKLFGIGIGMIGALFIVLLPLLTKGENVYGDFTGNIFVFLALICFALYAVGSRHLLSNQRYTPLLTTALNFFTTTLVCGLTGLVTGQNFISPALGDTRYLVILFYTAIPMTVFTFGLLQWVFKHISASSASLKDYIQLIVAVGLNGLILGEKLTVYYFIGSTLVILGVFIVTGSYFIRKIHSYLPLGRK